MNSYSRGRASIPLGQRGWANEVTVSVPTLGLMSALLLCGEGVPRLGEVGHLTPHPRADTSRKQPLDPSVSHSKAFHWPGCPCQTQRPPPVWSGLGREGRGGRWACDAPTSWEQAVTRIFSTGVLLAPWVAPLGPRGLLPLPSPTTCCILLVISEERALR